MKIIIFSGQENFTREVRQLIDEKKIQDISLVVESAGQETEKLAKSYYDKGAKVFIARGQNYDLLRDQYDIPVVNVKCNYEDILLAFQKVPKNSKKIAILGYGSIFDMITKFKTISKETFTPIEFKDVEVIDSLVEDASKAGFDTFIGGIRTKQACKKFNLNHIMLEISSSSIEIALSEAIHLLTIQTERDKNFELIQTLLDSTNDAVISYDQNKAITFINAKTKQLSQRCSLKKLSKAILNEFNSAMIFDSGESVQDTLIEIDNVKYILSIMPLKSEQQIYGAVAYLKSAAEIISSESSIRRQLNSRGHFARKTFDDIISESHCMKTTIEQAKKFAVSDNAVFISGDSGTGKELFAQSIHNYSSRKKGPFIAINCAALSPSVLESELFGYTQGAFTGASKDGKMGIFELAHNGTVFLDEIGEIDSGVQAKLLRVLQEKEIVRVGGENVIPVNVRILSATNRKLHDLAKEGKFRQDLFYRLAVLELTLPPLNERRQDIPLIVTNYLKQNYPAITVNNFCLDLFTNFHYPGNIRHLINLIERCVVMSNNYSLSPQIIQSVIEKEIAAYNPNVGGSVNMVTNDRMIQFSTNEKEYFQEVLRKNLGNRKKTAMELGISTTTLWRKLKNFNLS